jgi:hypothetical protein
MDAKIYLRKQIRMMWYLQDAVLKGLTDEHLTQAPPGTAHPIGIIWLHMAAGEDGFVSTILQQPKLWDSDGWKERFGLEKAPNMGEDWTEYKDISLTIDLLKDYTKVVRAQTKTCLKSTTSDTLDETVKFTSESDPKANVWVFLVGHTLIHSGEIAAIKGILGEKGLPF